MLDDGSVFGSGSRRELVQHGPTLRIEAQVQLHPRVVSEPCWQPRRIEGFGRDREGFGIGVVHAQNMPARKYPGKGFGFERWTLGTDGRYAGGGFCDERGGTGAGAGAGPGAGAAAFFSLRTGAVS